MTTRPTLHTREDMPEEDVEGETYQTILDMQYYGGLEPYVANPVHLRKNSQGEENIPVFDAKSTGLYFMRSMWRRK